MDISRQGDEVTSTSVTAQAELQQRYLSGGIGCQRAGVTALSSKIPVDMNRVRVSLTIYRSSRHSRS